MKIVQYKGKDYLVDEDDWIITGGGVLVGPSPWLDDAELKRRQETLRSIE